MHRFYRRHDAANEIEEASLFGNAAEHPGVSVTREDMLKNRVAAMSYRRDLDHIPRRWGP